MTNVSSIPWHDPLAYFMLWHGRYGSIWLDSPAGLGLEHGRYSYILVNPAAYFVLTAADLMTYYSDKSALPILQDIANAFTGNLNPAAPLPCPFGGGLVGYYGYEFGDYLASLAYPHLNTSWSKLGGIITNDSLASLPVLAFGAYDLCLAFDHKLKRAWLISTPIPELTPALGLTIVAHPHESRSRHREMLDVIARNQQQLSQPQSYDYGPHLDFRPSLTEEEYCRQVARLRGAISRGDLAEINFTQRFSASIDNLEPFSLYQVLRNQARARFSCYQNWGGHQLLLASPEEFILANKREIRTQPIKGTLAVDDSGYSAWRLQRCPKNRAENLMIVDLMRNDFSKICEPASVHASKICAVATLPHLHQLYSEVTGTLQPGIDHFDILPACYPAGSITGAPKLQAMQMIAQCESAPRGPYCGAYGYFGWHGNTQLAVNIRSAYTSRDKIYYHAGGAITLDSSPRGEYLEMLLKCRTFAGCFVGVKETHG